MCIIHHWELHGGSWPGAELYLIIQLITTNSHSNLTQCDGQKDYQLCRSTTYSFEPFSPLPIFYFIFYFFVNKR